MLRKFLGRNQHLKSYKDYVKPNLQYVVLANASTDKKKLQKLKLRPNNF